MYAFLPRRLPERLGGLTELALNLRWSWSHALDTLWQMIDAELWQRTHNPWVVLQNVPQARLLTLQGDAEFVTRLDEALLEHRHYHQRTAHCEQRKNTDQPAAVAYFSMEFGLGEAFPLYAGGLGVLAGDYLKTASDLGVPLVGIGLLYQEGYFRQVIDAEGRQRETYPYNDPTSLPIQPVIDAGGAWLELQLPLPGRLLYLRVWQAQVGRNPLYLLDSNDVRNGAVDRGITAKLYGETGEIRLLQQVVLGFGGVAVLQALNIDAEVFHLNEGHAAFALLERARRFMHDRQCGFEEAWWATRAGNVFTTHTSVDAAFDRYPAALIDTYARGFLDDTGMQLEQLLALGRCDRDDPDETFNMAYLALRGCARANAVSRLHGQVSRRLFQALYPHWPTDEVPLGHITNGVHVPSWDSPWADGLWTRACGKERWLGEPARLAEALTESSDAELWEMATAQRNALVDYARERLSWQLGQRGACRARIEAAAGVLDPNTLTLGLAHRFAEYKRPNLLLHDPDQLGQLLSDPQQPMQLIVAGKAHPRDDVGKALLHAWLRFARRPDMRHRVVFLQDYDMALAELLVQGVDAWINTPRRPWEACGTSGMKVLVNGGLNISELDGWWDEAYQPDCGWAIGGQGDDDADAEHLYMMLREQVGPSFYRRDADGLPRDWLARMRISLSRLAPQYSSNRMLLEYLDRYYRPASADVRQRQHDDAALARELAGWKRTLAMHWHEVHFGELTTTAADAHWRMELPVFLGGIDPRHVRVELYADAAESASAACVPMQAGAALPGAVQGFLYRAEVPDERPAEDYTPRVRAWHAQARLPAECGLITWMR